MGDTKDDVKPGPGQRGAFGDAPPADTDALRRYKNRDQLQPQGSNPAGKQPTDPEAIERSDLPERDKQYGSNDN
jgi:hypothetical protein